MIYLDTAYILKCYLREHGSAEVLKLAAEANGLASCILARVEFFSAVHRHLRESKIDTKGAASVFRQFRKDEAAGYWNWHPLTPERIHTACARFENLTSNVFLRSADALHLTCAKAEGYDKIYSNDSHLLAAAPSFELEGINIISQPS